MALYEIETNAHIMIAWASDQAAAEAVDGQAQGRLDRPHLDQEEYEERALHEGQS